MPARTKTGKARSDSGRKHAKSRGVQKLARVLDTFGDEAQQAQALKDVSESRGKRAVAKAAG